jgi:hypothetical protein
MKQEEKLSDNETGAISTTARPQSTCALCSEMYEDPLHEDWIQSRFAVSRHGICSSYEYVHLFKCDYCWFVSFPNWGRQLT